MKEITLNDWDKAKRHFDSVLQEYKDLIGTPGVNTTFAIMFTFNPLLTRYENGERTDELYYEMMSVE